MDFMPEIKMDFIPSDEEIEEEVAEVQEEVNEETGETNPNFVYEEKEEEKEEEPPPPQMKPDDIFATQPKLTKSGKPRKKRPPMSEEHKAKLAKAREKAMEVRKKKAQEKKESNNLDKQEKELLKKQKVKRVQKLKEEVEDDKPAPIREASYPTSTITKKDLEEAQLEAIMKYETMRKQRKKEKREVEAKEREDAKIRATLMRAVAPKQDEYNPFAGCY